MAWHTDYIKIFLANPGYNDAGKHGVSIIPDKVTPAPGQPYWRVIGIHHLTGIENHGQHNVFCDVIDEQGKRLYGTKLVVENINHTINHVIIDKGENEPGTNAPMHWDDILEFYVATGGLSSDHAKGFHTRHEDEEAGTRGGHHSFYVVWQRTIAGATPPPIEAPPVDPPAATVYAHTAATFYLISADGVRIGQVISEEWAQQIVDALKLLEASKKDHRIESYVLRLKEWNEGNRD